MITGLKTSYDYWRKDELFHYGGTRTYVSMGQKLDFLPPKQARHYMITGLEMNCSITDRGTRNLCLNVTSIVGIVSKETGAASVGN